MIKVKEDNQQLIFTDVDKHNRAIGLLGVINGKPASPHLRACYSLEGIELIKARMIELMAEHDIKLTDSNAVRFIYEKLGGGIITQERAKAIKQFADRNKIGKKKVEKVDDEEDVKDEDKDEDE